MTAFAHGLNAEQQTAIGRDGNVLLVASPGSGKTRTLIHKIASELSQVRSHREFVIALTYTHVAAEEIRDRIDGLGVDTAQLWVGTIHSFCMTWILRPYGIYHEALREGFSVIDSHDRESILDEIAKRNGMRGGHHDCKYYATEDGYSLDKHIPPNLIQPLKRTIEEYHARLLGGRQIDFEMMLKFAHDLIAEHEPIAKRLGQIFKIIAIDEYQDTRDIQYFIVSRIIRESTRGTKLFAVGDPNQAIFSSLGGVAKSAREIESLTGRRVKELALRKNYRSSQQIVDYFSNFAVAPMTIEAAGEWLAWEGHVVHDTAVEKSDLIHSLAGLIRYNVDSLDVVPHQICILAPWWIHLASITRALVQELPEYEFNGPGLSPFGQNLDNFWYKIARIALTEAAPDMFRRRMRWAREILDELVAGGHIDEEVTSRDLLKGTNGIDVTAAKGSVFLSEFFDSFCARFGIRLRGDSDLATQRASFFNRMSKRLADILKLERVDVDDLETFKKVFREKSGIVVSTIHGVKGREFDSVIAFGLLEGIVPHFAEPDQEKVSTAKRLLFVVGSRARKNLFLISEKGRGNEWYPKYQSNVLKEILDSSYTSRSIARLDSYPTW